MLTSTVQRFPPVWHLYCYWHTVRCISKSGRKMIHTTSVRPDHLERTASSSRDVTESAAVVEELRDVSPTVKFLSLAVRDKRLTFSAGQWVDFFIPGLDKVGGFSMCSAPQKLHECGRLDLAVKYSKHPPAHWIHRQCRVGSEVALRVGGDFHYSPPEDTPLHSLLLLAGGVGINPLYSILRQVAHLRHDTGCNVRASLLYSARTSEELIFKEEIEGLMTTDGLASRFFVTRQEDLPSSCFHGRIDKTALSQELRRLEKGGNPVTTYICGPGAMIDNMESLLQELGQCNSRILYEKWW